MNVNFPRAELVRKMTELRLGLIQSEDLMDQFEKNPQSVFAEVYASGLNDEDSECMDNLSKAISETPAGVRFLTYDYLISMITAEGDDPEITPYGPIPIPIAAANIAAIYNAIVIGNAALYHDVGGGVELLAGAVWTTFQYQWGTLEQPAPVGKCAPRYSLELSDPYLEGNLHAYLKANGLGDSREKMLINSALMHSSGNHDNGREIVSKYTYRGQNFVLTSKYDSASNQVMVTGGSIE